MDTVKAGAENFILMNSLGELERTGEQQRGTFREHALRERVERLMERKKQEELGETNCRYFYKAEFHNEVFQCPLLRGQVVLSILALGQWGEWKSHLRIVENN